MQGAPQNATSKFPFLKNLSEKSDKLIGQHLKTSFFQEKRNLIFKGDRVSGVYLVEAGCLRVYNINSKGRETTLYTVQSGQSCLFALNCVFSDLLYPAWVSIDSPSTKVLIIPSEIFKKLYAQEAAIRNFTFNVLSDRIFDLMSTLEEVTSEELDQRLASFLVRKANLNNEVKMSHQEIASHLGTAREVVSRLLRLFEKKRLVQTSWKCIQITSVQKLAAYNHSRER
jgi:CRP/FNR family transcriptional regulator